ncbi:lipoprotein [Actibacterium mucosum KCTC 23349]|uniref:Lipoprotein n=1 Tax=Actibacterium mucosum KCTC 23349 TaxID=1454373 RepID=A0A037ZK04_9RHOB|nr:hypothetical protein [Actibacterium mucosum]KAJ55944.1 lipoprotein [Actibacterium mucosum KCTC 23349]
MTIVKGLLLATVTLSLSACVGSKQNKTVDRGLDAKPLTELKAGIWTDPNGCDHWIIDDGIEGYLSQRLDRYGKPVCSGAGEPGTAVGGFKSGSGIGDPV